MCTFHKQKEDKNLHLKMQNLKKKNAILKNDETNIAQTKKNSLIMAYDSQKYPNIRQFIFKLTQESLNGQKQRKNKQKIFKEFSSVFNQAYINEKYRHTEILMFTQAPTVTWRSVSVYHKLIFEQRKFNLNKVPG